MSIVSVTVACVLLLPGAVRPQSQPERRPGDLTGIYGGVVQYANPEYDSVALLDFGYSVERRQFDFYRPDSSDTRFFSRIFAQVDLIDSRGYVSDSASTIFSAVVDDMQKAKREGIRLFDRLQLFAKPGLYSARLTVIDAVSKRTGEVFIDEISVEPPRRDSLTIGGVCIAHAVRYVGDATDGVQRRLVRNGYEIVPNPLAVFADEDSVLSFYSEIYNLMDDGLSSQDSITLTYHVTDPEGDTVRPLGMRRIERPGPSAVLAENLDMLGLPPGTYQLRITAEDRARSQVDSRSVGFRILVPRRFALQERSLTNVSAVAYDTLSLEVRARLVEYMLTPDQAAVFNSLSEAGKLNYLEQYWQEHDSDPTTKVNETRREMLRRYNYANLHFSNNPALDNGWNTDRGRIYMTYGSWAERDRNPAPRTGNAYEIWYYRSVEEGKVFVFEDIRGVKEYQLVHSNVEGEYYSEYWHERLSLEGMDVY